MFSNPEKILIQFGLSSGMYVADFAAGAGYYAELLAMKVGESGKVFAIEVNKDMTKRLARSAKEKRLENLEVTWGDLETESGSQLQDAAVDVVVIANALFALENKKAVAIEAKRVLKKKGRMLLVEWADSFAGIGPHKDHVFKEEDAKKVFEEAGLLFDRKLDSAGDHHYALVFRN